MTITRERRQRYPAGKAPASQSEITQGAALGLDFGEVQNRWTQVGAQTELARGLNSRPGLWTFLAAGAIVPILLIRASSCG